MLATKRDEMAEGSRGELYLLLLASLAIVVTLLIVLSDTGLQQVQSARVASLLLVAVVLCGAALTGAMIYYARRIRRAAGRSALEEAARLRKSLAAAEAIIKAEPQVLVYWEQGQGVRVATHTLVGVPGVPETQPDLLKFGQWLDYAGADELKRALDALFSDGRPFNLLLRTSAGGDVEADGRAAGGRAILRLRGIAGYKRDLARILDQHRTLSREVKAARALFDALPSPVWTRGSDGRLDWVNDAYAKAVEAESAVEACARQLELLESRQREAAAAGLAANDVYRARTNIIAAGQRKPHDIVVVRHEDASAGAAIDRAAIETAKGELDRQVAAYDRTLDRVSTAVAIFGPEQHLVFFNAAFAALWQLDVGWLETKPSDGEILDRLRALSRLPEVVNYRDWRSRLVAAAKSTAEYEDWWHLPDGRTLHVRIEPRQGGGGAYLFDDATERIALERRYNALIDAQRETLDSLKEGVAVFATDGRLRLFNSAVAQIWRLSRATLAEGPHIDEIIRQCSVLYDDQRTWTRIARAVTGISDRRQPLDGQITRPDGSVVDFAVSPLPDGATMVTFADVTAARRYERALIERNEALMASDRLKSQFIGHVSYELRTPLTTIIGFGELLSNPRWGELSAKQRELLNGISVSSRSLLAIINDILDLATIDAGALELKPSPVEVGAIVEQAVMGVRDRATLKRIAFDIGVSDDVSGIIADEARMRQVLYNLLSNAIGFSASGDIIRIRCWRESGMLAIAVEDKGPGIPREHLPRVFERFESRSHGSTHRGTGLGLSIVKSLVELHGGTVTIEAEPGAGTRVTVRVPEAGAPARSEPPKLAQAQSPPPREAMRA